jgi:hypothetical protein
VEEDAVAVELEPCARACPVKNDMLGLPFPSCSASCSAPPSTARDSTASIMRIEWRRFSGACAVATAVPAARLSAGLRSFGRAASGSRGIAARGGGLRLPERAGGRQHHHDSCEYCVLH